MNIYISVIGRREFLVFEDIQSVPIDKIENIDLHAANGGASHNSVRIDVRDMEPLYFAFENADAVRAFLKDNRLGIYQDLIEEM